MSACVCDDAGQVIVGGMVDGLVGEWCGETGELVSEIGRHDNAVSSALLAGDTAYTGSWDSTVRKWKRCAGQWMAQIILELQHDVRVANPISQMRFLDSKQLIVGSWDGYLRVVSTESTCCKHAIEVFQYSGVRCIATNKLDEHWLVYAGTEDRFIAAWKISPTGTPVRLAHWKAHNAEVTSLLVAKIGNDMRLFSGSEDCLVRIWDPIDGYMYDEFHAHDGAILALIMAPNLLYCGSRDTTIRNFEMEAVQTRVRERACMRKEDLRSHQVQTYELLTGAGQKKGKKPKTKGKGKKKK